MTTAQLHRIFLECGSRISTDSRKICGGELFFALRGENFDGSAFAIQALEDGAAYSVVPQDSEVATSGNKRIIAVPDSLEALQQLACHHREHTLHDGKRITMLALTGTNGKTTTKELIKAVLGTKYKLTATEGNLNNNIGVPLTLLKLSHDTELAVVEMGASHPGDIKELVEIAHPDYGLITNVGRAHLLGFGDFEGVKRTKGELYDYINGIHGKCFINTGSEDLCEMAAQHSGMAMVKYGKMEQNTEIFPSDIDHPFLRMKVDEKLIETQLVGNYNADNVLAALAVGKEFGVKFDEAVKAIESYVPQNGRSQMTRTATNLLIVDAYNANPSSMAVALDNFESVMADNKAVFLGDMLELGAESSAEHEKIVRRLKSLGTRLNVLVGKEFAAATKNVDCAEGTLCFNTSTDAAEYLSKHPLSQCCVLVKGSRGTRMEVLIPNL